ncbi:uncharacterized protein AMSG_07558 [Thecamonas trahens ATCC 50062]|uniref:Uncharacterized protein n=1 Tax=Thecamonas trahens ATCC 50062 TaxID=461836 RepID=A0A0L0DGB5_THETB|nr:hypothetical protein AMSG_07558 [Thecamonas trahens ATCC 50062]KNC51377.1 hypothetical protein AMSG_07558 [Thecamonas trahens ATCC 50062]|eukprot:XP_013756045.1 hypothetical protein AMSG_07558 [Thecamonas trahens ATCC 50062]
MGNGGIGVGADVDMGVGDGVQCDFEKVFGMYYGIRAGALMVRKLLTGPVTDAFGYYVHRCLQACVVGQLGLQLTLFLGHWENAWVVIGIQMVLGTLNIQAQTCVLKVLKLHLDQKMPGMPDEQHVVINKLEAIGEGLATAFIAVATFAAYMLATRGGVAFGPCSGSSLASRWRSR